MQKEGCSQRTDFDLIQASAEDQDDAWDEILVRYYPRILRYFFIAIGSHEEAIQLAQDTFLDAFRSVDRCGECSELGPWLFRVARNNLLPYQRRRRKILFVSLEQESESARPDSHLQGSDLFVDHVEINEAVTAVIEQLSPAIREPLLLSTLAGFTAGEVAEILGIRKETAERRITRAKAEFRKLWGKCS